MIPFSPATAPIKMAQAPGMLTSVAPPPPVDVLYSGYDGAIGVVEAIGIVGITSAAAWVGISTGLKTTNPYLKAAGWVGGVGSILLGLLYLGSKTGVGQMVGIPALRVVPS